MVSQNIIYALHHPESRHVYVGKSTKGMTRPREHFLPSSLERYAQLPRTKWIKALRARGLEPEIAVLEESTTAEELSEAERFYITYFRSLGVSLLNCTDGGDGILGHRHDAATVAKMSAAGKVRAEKDPERLAEISRRYWASAGARERQRQSRKGKKWSAETRAKMSASHVGKPKSAEARANMSIAATDRVRDSERDAAGQFVGYRKKKKRDPE